MPTFPGLTSFTSRTRSVAPDYCMQPLRAENAAARKVAPSCGPLGRVVKLGSPTADTANRTGRRRRPAGMNMDYVGRWMASVTEDEFARLQPTANEGKSIDLDGH